MEAGAWVCATVAPAEPGVGDSLGLFPVLIMTDDLGGLRLFDPFSPLLPNVSVPKEAVDTLPPIEDVILVCNLPGPRCEKDRTLYLFGIRGGEYQLRL